ncbi:protein artichoke [Anoplophora glabripennis]|uniref:protein artichoke n=1 Tax=Anoplophora glabripennis TaxID=217634 RepID=UPI00087387E4|nr:protein artichoke [Anoplophora glabripennis]
MTAVLFALIALGLCGVLAEYIPPGPQYRCPKEKLLLHPCSCDIESDEGITVSCNNTNLASMSIALNNLATFRLPIQKLTIYKCHIAKLYGSLLYKLNLKVLQIEDTPIETIEEHTFLGVNDTLNEFHLMNSSLKEFPTSAFKILGNLTLLTIDGHRMTELPKDAFALSDMTGKLLKLQIANGNLTTPPPESLQPLRKLKTLDLHGNQIKDLKRNQFKGLRDVEVLDLSYNVIPKVDASHLADLTKLGWLNVSHNSLTEITRGAFARNTVLKVLNMSFNKIKRMDQSTFRGMRFLRRLYLSDNLISDVGRGTFGSLKRIGTIDLARNLIKKIDYQMFYQLNFIEALDVSENQVTEIQKLAFKDLYLTHINLSKNNISKIETGSFENCANITKLDMSYNRLSVLAKRAFDETTYATELQLSYNLFENMTQIPLQNMTGIKILNISHNAITSVPKKTFPKLYELHTIDMSYNNLTDIFNSVFQTLFSLRTLDLSHNNLESVKPRTFGAVPTLLRLDLSYNNLKSVARSGFTRLASTRELILRGNQLKTMFQLPISVSHMDLSYNDFEELPPKLWPSMNSLLSLDMSHNRLGDSLGDGAFTGLLTLQRLNLNYNGMTNPPLSAISELTSLQYLYLEGNNMTNLGRNAFGKLPVVFELNLASNNLNNISSRAFEGLLQVLVLNLTDNNLTYIPNGAFQGLVALQTLDLSNNKIAKLDNKTHGLLDDCLSLERLNLSRNKISFLTRKTFPSNPYIPYKLKEIDLSYNLMPVITFDLTFGTSKLEKLNLSHNSIADIRKGVIGNLTRLVSLDLSHNKLYDLTSDKEFFRLPRNASEIYLSNNQLNDLPWYHLTNVSRLSLLDVRDNLFEDFGPQLTDMVVKGTDVYFEGNPLRCDCFLRPLSRHFSNQLSLKPFYRSIRCVSPPYLSNHSLFDLPEERLNCPSNVNTTRIMERQAGEYGILSDLRFRELSQKKGIFKVKWRVMKHSDIADTTVFIRDVKNPQDIVFQATLPYFKRSLEIDTTGKLGKKLQEATEHQICLVARDSKNFAKTFYQDQCKDLRETISGAPKYQQGVNFVCSFLLLHLLLYLNL